MNADTADHRSLGVRTTVDAALETLDHSLLGLDRRRTALAVVYLLGLIAMFLVSYVGARVTIDGVVLDALTPRFDTFSKLFIATVTATILIVPPCYAAWNGGPALSFALPLVPVGVGDVIAGAYVLDLDVAIALTVGATAAALALVSTDVRRRGSLRFWRDTVDDDRLLFVTALTVVAAVGVGRFVIAAPPYMLEWYAPFAGCWLVPVGIVVRYWLEWLRVRSA